MGLFHLDYSEPFVKPPAVSVLMNSSKEGRDRALEKRGMTSTQERGLD